MCVYKDCHLQALRNFDNKMLRSFPRAANRIEFRTKIVLSILAKNGGGMGSSTRDLQSKPANPKKKSLLCNRTYVGQHDAWRKKCQLRTYTCKNKF